VPGRGRRRVQAACRSPRPPIGPTPAPACSARAASSHTVAQSRRQHRAPRRQATPGAHLVVPQPQLPPRAAPPPTRGRTGRGPGGTRKPVLPGATRSRGPPASGATSRYSGGQRLLHRLARTSPTARYAQNVQRGVDLRETRRRPGNRRNAGPGQQLAQLGLARAVADDHEPDARQPDQRGQPLDLLLRGQPADVADSSSPFGASRARHCAERRLGRNRGDVHAAGPAVHPRHPARAERVGAQLDGASVRVGERVQPAGPAPRRPGRSGRGRRRWRSRPRRSGTPRPSGYRAGAPAASPLAPTTNGDARCTTSGANLRSAVSTPPGRQPDRHGVHHRQVQRRHPNHRHAQVLVGVVLGRTGCDDQHLVAVAAQVFDHPQHRVGHAVDSGQEAFDTIATRTTGPVAGTNIQRADDGVTSEGTRRQHRELRAHRPGADGRPTPPPDHPNARTGATRSHRPGGI